MRKRIVLAVPPAYLPCHTRPLRSSSVSAAANPGMAERPSNNMVARTRTFLPSPQCIKPPWLGFSRFDCNPLDGQQVAKVGSRDLWESTPDLPECGPAWIGPCEASETAGGG